LVELDAALGTSSVIGGLGYRQVKALEFGPDGILYATGGQSNALLTIDPTTGTTQAQSIEACLSQFEAITFRVPEPASIVLLLSGAGMGYLRWRSP
jgi:hypothetical protein